MNKLTKSFAFHYPLKHKVVRDLRIVTEVVGELEVEALGLFNPAASVLDRAERYTVDLEAVRFRGTDIRPVLEVTGGLEEVEEAALRYFADLLEASVNKAA